jgi:hypothetical protein
VKLISPGSVFKWGIPVFVVASVPTNYGARVLVITQHEVWWYGVPAETGSRLLLDDPDGWSAVPEEPVQKEQQGRADDGVVEIASVPAAV